MIVIRVSLAALLLLCFASTSFAAPLDGYLPYEAFTKEVQALDASPYVAVRSLGKSLGGREIWLLTIGDEQADQHPATVVMGNVVAPQICGSEIALRLAKKWSAPDDAGKALLAKHTYYIIPRPDPDATEKVFASPMRVRAGNSQKTDDDRDFEFGEDPADDLNGDGFITQMRIEDEAGTWLPHPDDARVLIEADPRKNERGKYRILTEGKDDDSDDQWNEDGGDGVVFNRNFTHGYRPFAMGTGPAAVSEIESRAVVDFLFDRPNVVIVFSFSTEDNLYHTWKPDGEKERARIKTTILGSDAKYRDLLADEFKKAHGGADCPAPTDPSGSFSQWAYFHYGRWSLASRPWWIPKVEAAPEPKPAEPKPADAAKPSEVSVPAKKSDEKRGADDMNKLRYLEREKLEGFSNWTKVDHPDFPGKTVEVGGFRSHFDLNPPAKELDGLADKYAAYLTKLPSLLPILGISDAKAEALGAGTYRITAKFTNSGYLPTRTEMADTLRVSQVMQAELLGLPEDTKYISGSQRMRVETLGGVNGKSEKTWLVRFPKETPKSVTLHFFTPGVGKVEAAVMLP